MSTNNRPLMVLALAAAAMAILGLTPTSADAGSISYVKITGDADCGISTDNTYTHKLDFGTGTPGALINGVQFDAYNAAANGTLNFNREVSSGYLYDHAGNAAHNVSGGLVNLLTDMYYNGDNAVGGTTTWTLSGLTAGYTYHTRIYTRQWAANNQRTVVFEFDPDGAGPISDATETINEDDATTVGMPNDNDAYYINYEFTAVAGEDLVITVTQDLFNQSWHLYGLTNRSSPRIGLFSQPGRRSNRCVTRHDTELDAWHVGGHPRHLPRHLTGRCQRRDSRQPAGRARQSGPERRQLRSGRLELGQTYYWRIDEVNGAPDHTVFTGNVWSFTVEPYAYPVRTSSPRATASLRPAPARRTPSTAPDSTQPTSTPPRAPTCGWPQPLRTRLCTFSTSSSVFCGSTRCWSGTTTCSSRRFSASDSRMSQSTLDRRDWLDGSGQRRAGSGNRQRHLHRQYHHRPGGRGGQVCSSDRQQRVGHDDPVWPQRGSFPARSDVRPPARAGFRHGGPAS